MGYDDLEREVGGTRNVDERGSMVRRRRSGVRGEQGCGVAWRTVLN
jgi:hypothetical protein